MYAIRGRPDRARWSVMWQNEDDDRVHSKEFHTDHTEAVKFYAKLSGRRRNVTLRCKNLSFPPPTKYADKMEQVNAKGILWCGYCGELRRFVRRNYFMFEGLRVDEAAMVCPLCGISARMVATHNPLVHKTAKMRRERSDKGLRRE